MYTSLKRITKKITTIALAVFISLLPGHHIEAVDNTNNMIETEPRGAQIVKFDNSIDFDIKLEKMKAEILEEQQREKERLEQLQREEAERQAIAMKTVESSRNISLDSINAYTDLSIMQTVTADHINQIIDYWNSQSGGNSPFVGHGQTFIDAAKQSGLDPIYLLSHAGLESNWGKSNIAVTKHNYFGIGAFDSSPYESSYNMGNEVASGIISGAIWISNNYYSRGQTSLYTMRYNNGVHEYCTSDTWVYNIENIMRTSYSLIL